MPAICRTESSLGVQGPKGMIWVRSLQQAGKLEALFRSSVFASNLAALLGADVTERSLEASPAHIRCTSCNEFDKCFDECDRTDATVWFLLTGTRTTSNHNWARAESTVSDIHMCTHCVNESRPWRTLVNGSRWELWRFENGGSSLLWHMYASLDDLCFGERWSLLLFQFVWDWG